MKFRRYAATALAALMLAGVSACADGPGTYTSAKDPSAGPETSAAPDGDQAETPSAADFKDAIDEAQSKQKGQSAHIEASFDLSAGGQSMSMTMSGDYASGDDPEDSVMNMSIDVMGQKMQMRVVDESLYMKGPGMTASPAKPWAQVDLNDPNSPFAGIYGSADPQSFTQYFSGAKSLEELGTETVDGVETTHYVVTVSTKEMLAGNKQFSGMDPTTMGFPKQIKINAWLNSDQLPIKMVVPFGELGSFEAHLSKYGQPVHVVAPPANLVSQFGASSL